MIPPKSECMGDSSSSIESPKLVNVKVGYLRSQQGEIANSLPKYDNFREWLANKDNLYIGRSGRIFINKKIFHYKGSKWANPFSVKKYGRGVSLEKYKEYIKNNKELLDSLHELAGKNIGCWCHPKPCHGAVLVELFKEKFS